MTDETKLIELLRAASVKGGMCDVAADLIEQQAARIAELVALLDDSRGYVAHFTTDASDGYIAEELVEKIDAALAASEPKKD